MTRATTARLGDLTEPVVSWNPTRSPDEQFDYIDLSSVDQNSKLVSGATRLLTRDAPSRARQLVSPGDVLVSTVRPNLNGVAVVPESLENATASTGFTVLRPGSGLEGRYLFHWVRSPHFIDEMVRSATGASYPAVSDRIVKASLIPLPPLDVQRRIAAILDQADALRARRGEALADLDDLAQSIFRDMFGDIGSDSDGPQRIPLNDLCTRITDGTHQSPSWSLDGNPFLFISNIVTGEIDFDTKRFISDQTHRLLTSRCPIEIGDVLYSTVGSYGVPALVRTDQKFAFQRHIAHIKPNRDLLEPQFLRAMLASPGVRRQADTAARGVAQKTVNLADIKKFSVVTPPMARQLKFVDRLSKVSELQRMHRSHLDGANDLFSALQTRAFAGKL